MDRSFFSTVGLAQQERANYWATLVCDTFVELDCKVPQPESFHGEIDCLYANDLQLFHIVSSAHHVKRTRSRIARSEQTDFLLTLQTSGTGEVNQEGRQALLRTGDFTLVDPTRPYDLRFGDDFSQIVMRLPRFGMSSKLTEIQNLTAQRTAGDRGIGKLASSFMRQLHSGFDEIDPIYRNRIYMSALDLIASAVSEQAGRSPRSNEGNILLRRRVRTYIDRHLADTRLSCESIAKAHGISTRRLSKAFEEDDFRVSQLIWARRLEQARRDAADPLQAHLSLTSIAFNVGFKDVAHFSRLFKESFGVTPTTFRTKARLGLEYDFSTQARADNEVFRCRQDDSVTHC